MASVLMRRGAIFGLIILYVLSVLSLAQPKVKADINSCFASVSQHSVLPNSTTDFSVQLTNTDSNTIRWIRINRPSADFTITSNYASGWQATTNSGFARETNGELAPGQTMTITITAQVGASEVASANWTVTTSDQEGINVFTCSGSLGTAISSVVPDTTPPNVGSIVASELTTNSTTISWTTDEPATSQVSYGLDSNYGASTTLDSNLTTNHSVSLSGLVAGTGYHFKVISTDEHNNTANSFDNTFLTLEANESSNGGNNSNDSNAAQAPLATKIPIKDIPTEKEPPAVSIATSFETPFKQVPVINGTATDNEALAGIEYSVDGGVNWLQVDNDKGLGTKNATFSFKPLNLEDGNYPIIVRAIDTSRNIGLSDKKILVIDRLPPQVGGSNISAGPQIFQPNEDGVTYSLVGVDQKITFSAVGGATQIIIDAKGVFAKDPSKTFNLTKSPDTGLWSGIISFDKAGEYILTANSVDGAGNKTAKVVSTVQALQPGRIISKNQPLKDAEVVLYYQEPTTNTWTVWDGASYGQTNPQKTDAQGQFNLFVPPGKYYLKADAKNHRTLISNIFETKETMPILSSLSMKESRSFKVANKTFHIPSLLSDTAELKPPRLPLLHFIKPSPIVNKQISDFTLQDLNGQAVRSIDFSGKPTVITFISSWSPSAKEQLAVLSKLQADKKYNIIPIVGQEGSGRIKPIISISGIPLDVLTDPDGTAVDLFGVQSLPVSYIIDKHGLVKKVMVGVLSKEKIINALGD